MASNTLTRASEWTIEGGPGGDLVNLDDRVPPARAFALRLLAAWSAEDLDSFHALFQAAAADHHGRGEYLHGVFDYLVEWTQRRAEQVGNPHTLVGQLCKSIVRSGPSLTDSWGKLPGE